MLTRKRKTHPNMEASIEQKDAGHEPRVKRQKPRIKLEDAPPVHCLKNLIELSNSFKFYKNLDIVMLWRIAPYLQELDKMVGMESLKETVFYQVIYYLQGMHKKGRNEEYLHTVIYGDPGCGKTTVAKIIGKIYQALNVLSPNGTFKVAYRDDFVAGYLGQTATKTKKLLQSSIGGVLFIDEVYSLAPRSNDRDSFAKEAIDTLTGFLSEHKNDFCCIIAGYEDEIQNCFFAMNKGLERRFPWVHRITQYKAKELYEIFIKMVRDIEWDISFDEKFMLSFFEKHKDMFKNAGGDIETFLTKCKMFHSRRVFCLGKEHKFIISKEDVKQAIEFLEKNKPKEDKPPEHMYL
jgi:SpoVK/Ycf46/Vps4 family AAA+-type ATPase